MSKFNKSQWSKKDYAYEYLEKVDIQLMNRRKLIEILKSFYTQFLACTKKNNILDLGCGDGIIARELIMADCNISAVLVDASSDMILKAKEKMTNFKNIQFIQADIRNLFENHLKNDKFDFIVSSFAIHHLNLNEKKVLYDSIYNHLNDGGFFVNIDVVKSPSKELEGWYLNLWREYIINKQSKFKLKGEYLDAIEKHSNSEHYETLDTLTDQLSALKKSGFEGVDCFYKHGIFSMFGGRKQSTMNE